MAKPTTVLGTQVVIEVETGTPGTFAAPCALNTKGITFTSAVNEFNIRDCDDPNAAIWTERVIAAKSANIPGSGLLAMEAFETVWRDWALAGDVSKNIRFKLDVSAAAGGGYFTGAFVLPSFEISGTDGELAQVTISMDSDGEVTWVDAAS